MRTWGGRFSDNTDALTLQYTAGADRSLYAFDIAGSMAHARMLGHAGIISVEDSEKILTECKNASIIGYLQENQNLKSKVIIN